MTMYSETAALPRGTTEEVANFFQWNLLFRHGTPGVLLSDHGTAFLTNMLKELLQACNVVHHAITAHHPRQMA